MESLATPRGMIDSRGTLDRLLRFTPAVAELYERDHGRERVAELRGTALAGIGFYSLCSLTNVVLVPDILWLSVVSRFLCFTPMAMLLIWGVGHVGAVQRERLVLAGMLGAICPQIPLSWLTHSPLGAYTFSEFALALLFGNLVLALRFSHAIVLTVVTFLSVGLTIATKPGLDDGLRMALLLQFATASGISLFANYRMEARRCRDYLAGLRARLLREAAEQARQRFQDLSLTDALTGLPNRRALDLRLDAWLAQDRPVVVVMVDIDHFKRFNDILGHPAGDACLRRVAEALAALAGGRSDSLCARYGGEEFAVVLASGTRGEAVSLAADLVEAVTALGIPHPGSRDRHGRVTISVGVAFRDETAVAGTQSDGKAALLGAADRALYDAKRRGRNRAVIDEPASPGLRWA